MIFGVMAQYGAQALLWPHRADILGVAALAQAFSPSLLVLISLRFVLGLGVGADYVLSPVIMAEHSNRADRGKALGLGFGTMWPIGGLFAAVVKLTLDAFNVPGDLQWRIVLGFGAVPAFIVLYLRTTMPESARFLELLAANKAEAEAVMKEIAGADTPPPPPRDEQLLFGQVFAAGYYRRPHLRGRVAYGWVYDLGGLLTRSCSASTLIAKGLGLKPSHFTILNDVLFIIPASLLMSWFLIDKMGRKPLQVWGFLISSVVLVAYMALRQNFAAQPMLAFIIYGRFNVAMTGPGLVSGAGVFGVELVYHAGSGSVAQAVTVTGGRLGAAISAFVFPQLFGAIGEVATMGVLAGLSVLGGVCTHFMVPETGSRSLEEITGELAHVGKPAA